MITLIKSVRRIGISARFAKIVFLAIAGILLGASLPPSPRDLTPTPTPTPVSSRSTPGSMA